MTHAAAGGRPKALEVVPSDLDPVQFGWELYRPNCTLDPNPTVHSFLLFRSFLRSESAVRKSRPLVLDPTAVWAGLHGAVPVQTALDPNPSPTR